MCENTNSDNSSVKCRCSYCSGSKKFFKLVEAVMLITLLNRYCKRSDSNESTKRVRM